MSISKRKELEREIRRNDILDAAEKIFLEKGVEHTTMAALAKAAEYSKKTIYSYFQSKYDIYFTLFLRACDQNRSFYREAMDPEESALEKLRAMGRVYFRVNSASPWYNKLLKYWDLLTENLDKLDPVLLEELQTDNRLTLERVACIFKLGIKDGSFRNDFDPEQAAVFFYNSLTSIYSNSCSDQNDPELKFNRELEFLLHSFKNKSHKYGGEL